MILVILRFQEPLLAATTPLNSLVLLRVFVGLIASSPAVLVSAFFTTPNTWFVSLGVARVWRNIARVRTCNELLFQLKCNIHVSAHDLGHAGDAGDECVDTDASLGMRGLISENNVPKFWSKSFLCNASLRYLTVFPDSPKFCILLLFGICWSSLLYPSAAFF